MRALQTQHVCAPCGWSGTGLPGEEPVLETGLRCGWACALSSAIWPCGACRGPCGVWGRGSACRGVTLVGACISSVLRYRQALEQQPRQQCSGAQQLCVVACHMCCTARPTYVRCLTRPCITRLAEGPARSEVGGKCSMQLHGSCWSGR